MTDEQIAALRKLDRAPDGSCWYCKTVMRGHFAGCPVALIPRLLDERKALLDACKAADDALGNAGEGGRFYAAAIAKVQAAIAKAEAP